MIPLNGHPKSETAINLANGSVLAVYDENGHLYLLRKIKSGKTCSAKIPDEEIVFMVEDFQLGVANFKSSEANSGYYSMSGEICWSSIWDDVGPNTIKKATFQEWVDECARILAGDQEKIRE